MLMLLLFQLDFNLNIFERPHLFTVHLRQVSEVAKIYFVFAVEDNTERLSLKTSIHPTS